MASGLSIEQRMKIEANRQRALALRAARQQQQQQTAAAANCGGKSLSLVTNNNDVQPALSSNPARPTTYACPSSSTTTGCTLLRQFSGTSCSKTNSAAYPNKQTNSASFQSRTQPTTLADTSNRVVDGRGAVAQSVIPVKCCLVSKQKFAADVRYSASLVEIFKSIPSKQYGDESDHTCSVVLLFLSIIDYYFCDFG